MEIEGVLYIPISVLKHKSGRYIVSLKVNGIYCRLYRTHRVRMLYYRKHIPKGFILHHIDRNITNDTIDNLICLSRAEHNKIHKTDKNHYMFMDGNTYWKKPKTKQHKKSISQGLQKHYNQERDIIFNKCKKEILQNPSINMEELVLKIGRQSHKVFRRLLGTTFRQLKKDILSTIN